MAILNNSNAISTAGGYDINNSLRFRSSASAYLNRTPATTSGNQIFTSSFWMKRGTLGIAQNIFYAYQDANNANGIGFDSSNRFQVAFYDGGAFSVNLVTTQVFRDPSAWYHIVVAIDTTQATAANRAKLYVNGNQVTAFSTATYPSQNATVTFNKNVFHTLGAGYYGSLSDYFDGYITDINWITGQALTPSSFGETDTTTGSWKPKAYTGTYGTNGFELSFSDIATTSGSNAGLGKDFSGNANYWTTNNISVTAGVTYDAMIDSPTLTSATVANYCVMNPLKINGSAGTFSNANLNVTVAGDSSNSGTMAFSSGKIYFEVQLTAATESTAMIGIADSNFAQAVFTNGGAINYGYVGTGVKGSNGSYVSYGASYTVNDIIGVAADLDAGTLVFYKNGVSQGTAYTSIAGTFIPVVGNGNSGTTKTYVANFGQRPFAYTPPTGFVRLNTYNLPDSTVKKGNTVMDATIYTGTNAIQSITNASSFKPDFIWIKNRSTIVNHRLFDSVRGATKALFSSSTGAETTESDSLTAINSNGFTLGADNVGGGVNYSVGDSYVAWQWQAGQGSTSSNTSGTITSTVSVNTTAGFSVGTYTGTGTAATIGHGLGVAPKFYIVKRRNAAGDYWCCYHISIGATKGIYLNTTDAAGTSDLWNDTAPTSTVFSVKTTGGVNASGGTYVAYCWAEIAGFSKFGSYTGNGSADGSFVYLGFRPKFVLFKRTDTAVDWVVEDIARSTYNVIDARLFPSTNEAEISNGNGNIDYLSNGFKLRNSHSAMNASGGTYIYMAFAENPFKNALAR
jgi:hypothetical protein